MRNPMHWRRSRTVAAAVMMVMAAGVPASAAPFEVSDPELAAELAIEPLPGPDITLEAAIEAADKRNLTLRAARLELDRADAKLAQAWALVFPMATAGLNIVHADHADVVDFSKSLSEGLGPILEASGINLPPMESEPTVVRRQDTISGSITAAMSLVNVQSWYTISAARKGRDVARLTIESARQQLLAGVAQAYYLALMSRSLVEMQQNQVLSAAHHLDFATKRFDSGAGLRIDVVRAQTNLTEARQQLLGARLSLESARDALGVLTGSGDLPMPVAAADLPMPEGPDEKLVSWALKHRQDLAAGRASVVLADRQFGTSWAGFLPTFDMAWQGNYQFTEPSSLGSTDRSRWNLVFNLNVPIFQYFNIGALRDAKAAARIARLKLEDQRQAAGQEVRQARRDHEAAVASARLAEQQAELAREAMDLAQTAFEAGAGSSLEVTDARRTVTAAEVNRMTRLLQVQISRLVLHRALGTDVRDLVR